VVTGKLEELEGKLPVRQVRPRAHVRTATCARAHGRLHAVILSRVHAVTSGQREQQAVQGLQRRVAPARRVPVRAYKHQACVSLARFHPAIGGRDRERVDGLRAALRDHARHGEGLLRNLYVCIHVCIVQKTSTLERPTWLIETMLDTVSCALSRLAQGSARARLRRPRGLRRAADASHKRITASRPCASSLGGYTCPCDVRLRSPHAHMCVAWQVLYARDKYLKPSGAVLPDLARIYIAGRAVQCGPRRPGSGNPVQVQEARAPWQMLAGAARGASACGCTWHLADDKAHLLQLRC
jgi:hypothetical protein